MDNKNLQSLKPEFQTSFFFEFLRSTAKYLQATTQNHFQSFPNEKENTREKEIEKKDLLLCGVVSLLCSKCNKWISDFDLHVSSCKNSIRQKSLALLVPFSSHTSWPESCSAHQKKTKKKQGSSYRICSAFLSNNQENIIYACDNNLATFDTPLVESILQFRKSEIKLLLEQQIFTKQINTQTKAHYQMVNLQKFLETFARYEAEERTLSLTNVLLLSLENPLFRKHAEMWRLHYEKNFNNVVYIDKAINNLKYTTLSQHQLLLVQTTHYDPLSKTWKHQEGQDGWWFSKFTTLSSTRKRKRIIKEKRLFSFQAIHTSSPILVLEEHSLGISFSSESYETLLQEGYLEQVEKDTATCQVQRKEFNYLIPLPLLFATLQKWKYQKRKKYYVYFKISLCVLVFFVVILFLLFSFYSHSSFFGVIGTS